MSHTIETVNKVNVPFMPAQETMLHIFSSSLKPEPAWPQPHKTLPNGGHNTIINCKYYVIMAKYCQIKSMGLNDFSNTAALMPTDNVPLVSSHN